ncbi:MAG TPA: glycosyltransferase family 4 protein [Chthoniobacterales bacterium]|jgi:glycosyltransferase involved in cell wall biosynthesis
MNFPARVLIYSHAFHPSVGGSENAGRLLADGIVAAGHEVQIVTRSQGPATESFPYPIHYSPSRWELFRLVRWSSVYVHSNLGMRGAWPLLFLRRPWVIIHHSRITRVTGEMIWLDHVKRFCTRFARNIAVSQSMARDLPQPTLVIGNGYDPEIFHREPETPRARDIMFLGRLNRDKGCHLLFEALRILSERGLRPTVTVVGQGNAEEALHREVSETGLERQVVFEGTRNREECARLLNGHRILVVPSLVAETFGLVVLEGIACGCAVIVSTSGALEEIAGPCGVSFPSGDAGKLADRLAELLGSPERIAALQSPAAAHLAPFRSEHICRRYLAVILAEVRHVAHSFSLLLLAHLF